MLSELYNHSVNDKLSIGILLSYLLIFVYVFTAQYHLNIIFVALFMIKMSGMKEILLY